MHLDDLHQLFLSKFPRGKLRTMTVEEYVGSDGFFRWVNFKTNKLGKTNLFPIQGIISYVEKTGEWRYPDARFSSLSEAWRHLRADIVRLVEMFDEGGSYRPEELVLLSNANVLKGKILFLYHPDIFLPVYSPNHIRQYLKKYGVPKAEWEDLDSIRANLLLKKTLSARSEFVNSTPLDIMNVLYASSRTSDKCFKIAPGQNASFWEECYQGGFIAVGWEDVGRLDQYNSKEELSRKFKDLGLESTASKSTEKARELWQFYNLSPGDTVVANRGTHQILAIGTVNDRGYEYRDDLPQYKHVVYVDWHTVYEPPLEIPPQTYWAMKTVREIERADVMNWTSAQPAEPEESYSEREITFFSRLDNALMRKGQCILYGPPGTGKTYMARKYVHWKNEQEKRDIDVVNPTRKLWMMVVSRDYYFQWESILANQGVQQFDLLKVQSNFYRAKAGDLVICYSSGQTSRAIVGLAEIAKVLDENEKLTVRGIRAFREPIPYERLKESEAYRSTQAGRMNNRGTMFELHEEFAGWLQDELRAIQDAESAELLKDSKNNMEMCTFHQSFQYEDFIEGYKPASTEDGHTSFKLERGLFATFCEKAQNDPDTPYYLIIDEINRGNISKIFGELITLLEMDKRGVELKLPQSKTTFFIPKNLYLIGTMNTSDRSIKMMDAALKRRFAFIECMPDEGLLNQTIAPMEVSLSEILSTMNSRLTKVVGRDKQIGHAYFMKGGEPITSVKELIDVYELEILPLVQESCFDQYNLLADIVGDDFVDVENQAIRSAPFMDPDDFANSVTKHVRSLRQA